MQTTNGFTIQTSDGRQDRRLSATYSTAVAAADALREVMGWDDVVLSHSFEADGGSARSAYATQEECDTDGDGASAPRIVEA